MLTSLSIIQCNNTLYVEMTEKQNGHPIPCIHFSLARYRLWTGIKAKPAFRSHSWLIKEVRKLLTRGEDIDEVVNQQKVKKVKVKFLASHLVHIIRQSYQNFGWSYGATFNTNDLDFAAQSALSYCYYNCTIYGDCSISTLFSKLSRSNMPSCSIENNRLLCIGMTQQYSEQMTDFIASLGGSNP